MLIYKREFVMSTKVFFHPSVDIDPIPTGAGGIVRGATITLTGRAACIKETIDTDTEEEETEDSPESIRKVEVRLGASGAFVKGRPTGPVSSTTQQKTWTTWTTDPLTISGVVNDALQIRALVSAGVVADPTLAHDDDDRNSGPNPSCPQSQYTGRDDAGGRERQDDLPAGGLRTR